MEDVYDKKTVCDLYHLFELEVAIQWSHHHEQAQMISLRNAVNELLRRCEIHGFEDELTHLILKEACDRTQHGGDFYFEDLEIYFPDEQLQIFKTIVGDIEKSFIEAFAPTIPKVSAANKFSIFDLSMTINPFVLLEWWNTIQNPENRKILRGHTSNIGRTTRTKIENYREVISNIKGPTKNKHHDLLEKIEDIANNQEIFINELNKEKDRLAKEIKETINTRIKSELSKELALINGMLSDIDAAKPLNMETIVYPMPYHAPEILNSQRKTARISYANDTDNIPPEKTNKNNQIATIEINFDKKHLKNSIETTIRAFEIIKLENIFKNINDLNLLQYENEFKKYEELLIEDEIIMLKEFKATNVEMHIMAFISHKYRTHEKTSIEVALDKASDLFDQTFNIPAADAGRRHKSIKRAYENLRKRITSKIPPWTNL